MALLSLYIIVVPSSCFSKECSKGTARCVTFTCPLLNMTEEAQIHVRSRLWNSTMLEVRYTHTHLSLNLVSKLPLMSSAQHDSLNVCCFQSNQRQIKFLTQTSLNVCILQDYANALRVRVKGQATLKLITDKPTLRMESQTNMVRCYDRYGSP